MRKMRFLMVRTEGSERKDSILRKSGDISESACLFLVSVAQFTSFVVCVSSCLRVWFGEVISSSRSLDSLTTPGLLTSFTTSYPCASRKKGF